MNKGSLFVMSGPSGTGKGTICKVLEQEKGIFLSVSSTTREIRVGEKDGITYNYTTRDNFRKMIDEGKMLEWATYDGNYYGTPKTTVESMINEGKNVILEIDVQGAFKVKEIFPETVMIFVLPPSMEELKKRLIERGREGEDSIQNRMEVARGELELAARYNYVVVNDSLETCVNEVREIIKQTEEKRMLVENLLSEKY